MSRFSSLPVFVLALAACSNAAPTPTPGLCDQRVALANTPQWTDACANAQVDWADARCLDTAWQLPACGTLTELDGADFGGQHIPLPTPITYTDDPPMSGPHRAEWPFWGEYAFLPKQRWIHGLEHGAVTILYNPCVPESLVETLRTWAQSVPPDDAGAFRWLLTPYPGLDSAFSLVTGRHRLKGNCFDAAAAEQFRQAHYRHAAEDVPYDGTYACVWLGRSCGIATGSGDADAVDGTTMGGLVSRDGQ